MNKLMTYKCIILWTECVVDGGDLLSDVLWTDIDTREELRRKAEAGTYSEQSFSVKP